MTTVTRRRIAEGREAEVFEYDSQSVLKLYRNADAQAGAEHEAAAMTAVREAGGPAPEVRGFTEERERPGLILERVDGLDMLTLLGKKPWFALSCGRLLGEAHAALHETRAPAALPALADKFRRHIDMTVRAAPQHGELGEYALRELDGLPAGDRICHGDYHPGNVLVTSRGPIVIDWPGATRGDPHADVARTLLIFDIASMPPGSPIIVRALERFARRHIRSQYLSSYRKRRMLDMKLLERWRIPVAAERLADGIEDERETLLTMLREAMNGEKS